jgi:hypothetical protein
LVGEFLEFDQTGAHHHPLGTFGECPRDVGNVSEPTPDLHPQAQ